MCTEFVTLKFFERTLKSTVKIITLNLQYYLADPFVEARNCSTYRIENGGLLTQRLLRRAS